MRVENSAKQHVPGPEVFFVEALHRSLAASGAPPPRG